MKRLVNRSVMEVTTHTLRYCETEEGWNVSHTDFRMSASKHEILNHF